MKVLVSPHATVRLIERAIDIDSVKRVIRSPSQRTKMFDDRIEVTGTLGDGRILTVIYKTINKNQVVLITSYYENQF